MEIIPNGEPCPVCHGRKMLPPPPPWREGLRYSRREPCSCVLSCLRCDGEGDVPWTDDRGYEFLKPCPDCGPVRDQIRLYNYAKIPEHFDATDVESFAPKTSKQAGAQQYARQWLAGYRPRGRGFLMAGPTGVGKTHLVVGVVKGLVERRLRCQLLRVRDILEGYKARYERDDMTAGEYRAHLCTLPILVLDELAELITEWQRGIISDVIESRYASGKTTLGTTNLAPEDIPGMFGEAGRRVVSRMREMMELVVVTGPDGRGAKP